MEFATRAARFGAVTFGVWVIAWVESLYKFWLVKYPANPSPAAGVVAAIALQVIVGALFVYLTWRTYRKPNLLLCLLSLAVATAGFAVNANSKGTFPTYMAAEIVAALIGVNGAWRLQRLQASGGSAPPMPPSSPPAS